MGTTPANVPAEIPYLQVDGELIKSWASQLAALKPKRTETPVFRVGIAWQGNPDFLGDRQRSMSLRQFAPLAQVPGVELVSLQKGFGTEQLAAVAGQFAVLDLESRLGHDSESLMAIAAIMKNLDLVITCDTAIAHLAGALGVQVWVPIPMAPDWRWMLDRDDSPWYPTLRLYRQTRYGIWEDVFQRMTDDLQAAAGRPNPAVAHGNQALALAEAGKFQEAESHFREALRLDPNYVRVHNNFGNALVQMGRVAEGTFHYREALRLKPDHAHAHSNLAHVFNLQGDPEQAEVHCRTALRNQPDLLQARHNLGGARGAPGKVRRGHESF